MCRGGLESMSKTVSVTFDGRWLWAYDVSLAILLLEAAHVGLETPVEQRPPRTDAVLEDLRIQVRVSDCASVLPSLLARQPIGSRSMGSRTFCVDTSRSTV